MRRPTVASGAVLFALAALTLVLLRPLTPVDETRYLAVAWEMFAGGSKLVPHLNGALYGHKPPLLFWLIDAVWAVAGVGALPARLVGPAAATLAVALTGLIARRLWPATPARAGRAALILAATPMFLIYGSATMFDALLAACVLVAVLGLMDGRWWLAGLGLGLGVLAKGPVALIHVLPLALTLPLWRPATGWPEAARATGIALAVALAVVALWLGPALVLGGAEYRTEVLWRQSAGRMVASFAHRKPVWFYAALLPLIAWPFGWSLAAPRPGRAAGRLLAVWLLVPLAAFSAISGKQLHYLLPELPAAALLLASASAGATPGRARALLLALVVGLALAAAAGAVPDVPAVPWWAAGLAVAAALAGLAGLLRLPAPTGPAALGLAAVVGLHFAAAPALWARMDTLPIGRVLAASGQAGVALGADAYHGQFNFAARLRRPIDLVPDPAAQAGWAAAHPGGLLILPEPAPPPPSGAVLIARLPLRGDVFAIHRVPQ